MSWLNLVPLTCQSVDATSHILLIQQDFQNIHDTRIGLFARRVIRSQMVVGSRGLHMVGNHHLDDDSPLDHMGSIGISTTRSAKIGRAGQGV